MGLEARTLVRFQSLAEAPGHVQPLGGSGHAEADLRFHAATFTSFEKDAFDLKSFRLDVCLVLALQSPNLCQGWLHWWDVCRPDKLRFHRPYKYLFDVPSKCLEGIQGSAADEVVIHQCQFQQEGFASTGGSCSVGVVRSFPFLHHSCTIDCPMTCKVNCASACAWRPHSCWDRHDV
jgi:hypothetical protein